ncbi:MAG: OsmC family protein [Cohaesibacteraceae bacterium]|nr:OsmC family protein [Cohaesibacteraceae bacterium]MBL4876435.1 OsmC family protein [Cohaesibacteraceae bacterium]
MVNKVKINVQGTGTSHTRTDLLAGPSGEFCLISDEPPVRGGNNEGMLPLEVFLAGYIACTNVIMNIIAHELGITFSEVTFKATGHLNPLGYMGKEKLSTPFIKLELTVSGNYSGEDEQLDELREQLVWRCPAAATLASSGTEILDIWNLVKI